MDHIFYFLNQKLFDNSASSTHCRLSLGNYHRIMQAGYPDSFLYRVTLGYDDSGINVDLVL